MIVKGPKGSSLLLISLLVSIEYISKGLSVRVEGEWERLGAETVDETAGAGLAIKIRSSSRSLSFVKGTLPYILQPKITMNFIIERSTSELPSSAMVGWILGVFLQQPATIQT